jgi:sugar O-acyltransferase (sialic acid O-acetyltransferase NeuD family)
MNSKINKTFSKSTPQKRPLVIFGSGGHAVSVANVALSAGYKIECFIDYNKVGQSLLGYKIRGEIAEILNSESFSLAIAIGNNSVRESMYKEIKSKFSDSNFPILVHSSAVVSFFSELSEGSVVMPNAIIGPNTRIGKFCIVNSQASIDHDGLMLDFSSLAPAAILGGNVRIGTRSAICIGSVIKQNIFIGDDSIVGANSYLNKDLSNNQVAYGSPAKPIRTRTNSDDYLK